MRPVILPSYSPELNPCELVLHVSKSALARVGGVPAHLPWHEKVIASFASVTREQMLSMYETCIVFGGNRRRK